MTELKTQKEIYNKHLKDYPDSRRALEFKISERQAAIKWIKHLKENSNPVKVYENETKSSEQVYNLAIDKDQVEKLDIKRANDICFERIAIIEWIKGFFNITEEDLK